MVPRVCSQASLTSLRFPHTRPAAMYGFGNRFVTHMQVFKDHQISAQNTRSTGREISHHTHVRYRFALAVQSSQTGFHLSGWIYRQTAQKSSHPSCLTLKNLQLSCRGYPRFLQTSSVRTQTSGNYHVITPCRGRWVSKNMENSVKQIPLTNFARKTAELGEIS